MMKKFESYIEVESGVFFLVAHMITIDEQAAFAKHFGTLGFARTEDDGAARFLALHATGWFSKCPESDKVSPVAQLLAHLDNPILAFATVRAILPPLTAARMSALTNLWTSQQDDATSAHCVNNFIHTLWRYIISLKRHKTSTLQCFWKGQKVLQLTTADYSLRVGTVGQWPANVSINAHQELDSHPRDTPPSDSYRLRKACIRVLCISQDA